MATDTFTDPADSSDDWVDVRMTDPAAGEWDIDLIVADGSVEYVDLRIHPDLVAGFIGCLVDDVSDARAAQLLAGIAERRGLELEDLADATETTGAGAQDSETEP